MPSKGGRFTSIVLPWGPVPPADGPYRDEYLESSGLNALATADRGFEQTVNLLGKSAARLPKGPDPLIELDSEIRGAAQLTALAEWNAFRLELLASAVKDIEPLIKQSESAAVAALNFLEDHELAETAHAAIHRAAFVRRGLFGCPIVYREGSLWTNCSINLSHLRMGSSAAISGTYECSICGEPAEDCDHRMGSTYEVTVKRNDDGTCNVCQQKKCDHLVGTQMEARAVAMARNMVAHEVSHVARPRYPQARFIEETIDMDEDDPLWEMAIAGELHCNICFGPCKGFNHMAEIFGPVERLK